MEGLALKLGTGEERQRSVRILRRNVRFQAQFECFLAPAAWVHTTLAQLRLTMVLRLGFEPPGMHLQRCHELDCPLKGSPRRCCSAAAQGMQQACRASAWKPEARAVVSRVWIWSPGRLLGLRLKKWPGSDFGISWLTVEYRKIRGFRPRGGQQGRGV